MEEPAAVRALRLAAVAVRQTKGGNVLLIVGIVVPCVGLLLCAFFLLYSYFFRDKRQLPAPAPVATPSAVLSPRRRETFVGGDMTKLDSFQAHERSRRKPCALCRHPLSNAPVSAGRCGHMCHTACLSAWVARQRGHASCPTCHRDMSTSRVPQLGTVSGGTVESSGVDGGQHTRDVEVGFGRFDEEEHGAARDEFDDVADQVSDDEDDTLAMAYAQAARSIGSGGVDGGNVVVGGGGGGGHRGRSPVFYGVSVT